MVRATEILIGGGPMKYEDGVVAPTSARYSARFRHRRTDPIGIR